MRRLLIGLILILLVLMPLSAMGAKEELCTGLEIEIYGKPKTVVPETCVPCSFDLCARILDKCPAVICTEGGSNQGAKAS